MKKKIAIAAALAAWTSFSALAAEAAAGPKLAYGLLMKQGDKLVFAPCRDRSYAIVDDVSPNASVSAALKGIGLDAGKKLYVELMAVVEGATLKASSLNFARAEGRCQQPGGAEEAWRAVGSDWGLAAGGEQVLVKRPGKPDFSVPYQPFPTEGSTATYEATREGNKLALRFERAVCHDQAGAALLGWNATVTVNGEVLKGCAWQR